MKLPICAVPNCGKEIQLNQDILKEVIGWLRPQGTGGGQIVQRRETGRFAHRRCVEWGPSESRMF
jgi:hypothetical protein